MAIFVVRKPGESADKALNRFKKLTQRDVRSQKDNMYREKDLTKRQVREKALVREKYRKDRERMSFYS